MMSEVECMSEEMRSGVEWSGGADQWRSGAERGGEGMGREKED